jgi:hypothetical protein
MTYHLSPHEIIDIAEGVRPEAGARHLASCEHCRRQLQDVRAAMTAARNADVPEPSPLFWDHFSARVSGAVASEGASGRLGWLDRLLPAPRIAAPIVVTALIVVAIVVAVRVARAPSVTSPPATINAIVEPIDDPLLELVADLGVDVDWDSAAEVGLTTREGTADKAVMQLTDAERVELQRLLQQELRRSGD